MTNDQANFLQALGWAILNSLWQLALLWVIYQAITSVYKNARPSAKSALASSLLVAGFGWFLYTFMLALTGSRVQISIATANIADDSYRNVIYSWIQRSLPVTSVIYLAFLIIPFLKFIRNYRYVQVIRKDGLTKMGAEWRLFVNKISSIMGIKKPVHIWVSEWVSSPVTIGYLKPVILVPLAAMNNLSTSQMEAILLHELAHIRRFDYLVNFIMNMIRVVLYFNPFAKAFIRIVEKEREKSCDELVLQFQYDSHDYSSALLTLEKISFKNRILVVPATGLQQDLLSRVESILGIRQRPVLTARRFGAVLTGLLALLALNAILLVTKPQSRAAIAFNNNIFTLPAKTNDLPTGPAQEQATQTVYTNPLKQSAENRSNEYNSPFVPVSATHPSIISANFEYIVPPVELTSQEEARVKSTMEASRKVIENEQWKQVELKLADAFNEYEKDELKFELNKELNKYDWKKLENKLRIAYDNLDWEKVSTQLNYAIARIQIDSLARVYTHTLSALRNVEEALQKDSMEGIPDTDITLKDIGEKQKLIKKALLELKAPRTKKIVQL